MLAPAACRRTLFGKAAEKHRLGAYAPRRQNEYEHEHEQATGALAGNEWAEGVPRSAPFGFALPKFRFEVSEVIRVALHLVQRL